MKKLIASVLVSVFCVFPSLPSNAEMVPIPEGVPYEVDPPDLGKDPKCLAGAVLVVSCAVVAGCIIYYLYRKNADPYEAHIFILQQDDYDGNWKEVARIQIALNPDKARALFAHHMERIGVGHRFRVKDLGVAP